MRRRELLALVAVVSILPPVVARAEQSTKVYRIAILHPSHPVAELTATSSLYYHRAFFEELRRLGYVEGQNLTIERFSGEGHIDNYPALARSVASRNPDAVFTVDPMTRYLKETSTVPIVSFTGDPIAAGFAQSLARPGGNITGIDVASGTEEIWAKRLQLLREIVPTISKVGFLWGPFRRPLRSQTLQTFEKMGVEVIVPTFVDGSDSEYRRVVASLSQAGVEALLVSDDVQNVGRRQLIAELASKFRLPAIYAHRVFAEAGGLIAYGYDVPELLRQCARQIDKILKGANPGEIPFYQPTKFELLINLKTAKELGLTVPPSMLSLADELIE